MKKRYWSLLLTGLIFLMPLYSRANDEKEDRTPLKEETPEEVVEDVIEDVIETGKINWRDVWNFLSRIDPDKKRNIDKYEKLGFLTGFTQSVADHIDEDRSFWFTKTYDEDELPIKRQLLQATADICHVYLPTFSCWVETKVSDFKENTTFRPKYKEHKFVGSFEFDQENLVQLKVKSRSSNIWLDDWTAKGGYKEIEAGREWYPKWCQPKYTTKRNSFCLDFFYEIEKDNPGVKLIFAMNHLPWKNRKEKL